MKKLNKKNQNIIDNLNRSLRAERAVLAEYLNKGNLKMVFHMQNSIKDAISSVSHFYIFHDNELWHELADHFTALRNAHELSHEYAMKASEVAQ